MTRTDYSELKVFKKENQRSGLCLKDPVFEAQLDKISPKQLFAAALKACEQAVITSKLTDPIADRVLKSLRYESEGKNNIYITGIDFFDLGQEDSGGPGDDENFPLLNSIWSLARETEEAYGKVHMEFCDLPNGCPSLTPNKCFPEFIKARAAQALLYTLQFAICQAPVFAKEAIYEAYIAVGNWELLRFELTEVIFG